MLGAVPGLAPAAWRAGSRAPEAWPGQSRTSARGGAPATVGRGPRPGQRAPTLPLAARGSDSPFYGNWSGRWVDA